MVLTTLEKTFSKPGIRHRYKLGLGDEKTQIHLKLIENNQEKSHEKACP
jgi:hypothetical protein